jgi:hypothetical protein
MINTNENRINRERLQDFWKRIADQRLAHVHKEITDDDNYYGYAEEYRVQDGYFRG